MSQFNSVRSFAKALDDREGRETCGNFCWFQVTKDRSMIILTLQSTYSITVPFNAELLRRLQHLKVGQKIAILQMENKKTVLRLL